MDSKRLFEILDYTTIQLRKGEIVTHEQKYGVYVTTVDAMPHETDPIYADLVKVDMVMLTIGVDKVKAEKYRNELCDILKYYPEPERLADGPSYIEVGGVLGDQGEAFQLFALGKVLGIWDIITPMTLGIREKDKARELAGGGLVMISGFRQNQPMDIPGGNP